jgi:predicted nucleic acid-binding protein
VWDVVRAQAGYLAARAFVVGLDRSPRVRVLPVPRVVQREATASLLAQPEPARSFVDSTSHIMMKRLNLDEALAFDPSFQAAGFVVRRD